MPRRRRKAAHGMGEIIEPTLPGGTYAIRWRDHGKRTRVGGFLTREDAEKKLKEKVADVALERHGLPKDKTKIEKISVLAARWLEKRKETNPRTYDSDRLRWRKHLEPAFGHLRPHEINRPRIKAFIESKLIGDGKLARGSIRVLVAMLSTLFTDLIESGLTDTNPAKGLPPSLMRLMKSDHDPKTTPFVEKMSDLRRIFLTLPEPLNIAFAIGAMAGLRTGEVFALKWEHVDLVTGYIHVRESVTGKTKDKDSRMVLIQDDLLPVLKNWKLKSGKDAGLIVPPLRGDGRKVDRQTPGKKLRAALKALELTRDGLGWYEATRHTFASQWVLAGGSIEKLSQQMGHYSIEITWKHYAHLRPDLYDAKDRKILRVDLMPGRAEPLTLQRLSDAVPGNVGPSLGNTASITEAI